MEYRPSLLTPQQASGCNLPGNLSSLLAAGYNSSWPVKVLIHGFGDSGITSWTDVSSSTIYDTVCALLLDMEVSL